MAAPIPDLVTSFARHLRAEGRADRTVALHTQAPRFFAAWLADHGRASDLDQLTQDNLVDWFNHLRDLGQEPGTIRMRHAGMLRFIGWLIAEDELSTNPMAEIRKPASPEKPVPVMSDNDLTALLKACHGRGFLERRDEAIIRFLLDTGIRVAELCGLTIDRDIEGKTIPGTLDLDSGSALVTGKRGKQRVVYFGARTERALDRYLRVRRSHRWAHLDALFLTQRGAMSTDGVRARLELRAEQAGLRDPSNPHRFRHTWAHDFLLAGGQERDLKRLAGWSGEPPIANVTPPVIRSDNMTVFRRPSRSPSIPKMTPPTGRATNPTAKVANAARVPVTGSRLGKNCLFRTSAAAVP